MSGSNSKKEAESFVIFVRLFLGYFCLILMFGFVILTVQSSIEEKKIRYRISDKSFDKMELLESLHEVNNQINRLESYQRITKLVEQELPMLCPPAYPAVELKVQGLEMRGESTISSIDLNAREGIITRLHRKWKYAQNKIWNWIRSFVE